jgi:hypothetical protein
MIAKAVEERLDTLDNHITWSFIADKLKLSPSALSHFRNRGTELGFQSLFELAKLLFPRKFVDILSDWCLNLQKPSNLKAALEFLMLYKKISKLQTLILYIKKNYESKPIHEIAKIYELLILSHKKDFSDNYINTADNIVPKTPEGKVLLSITKSHYYNNKSNINAVKSLVQEAEDYIQKVSNQLLKHSYETRIYEMKSVVLLFMKGNTKGARLYAEKVLENKPFYCDTFAAESYYRIGMSFLFESPDMCLANLKKAKKHFLKKGLVNTAEKLEINEIAFAKIHWGFIRSRDEIKDSSSLAHYEAKYGDKEVAKKIALTLNQDSPFTRYYLGITNGDCNTLLESLAMFAKKGNMFYAMLPKDALSEYKQFSNVIKILCDLEED